MPAIPIDRTTAWSTWMKAKVSGANVNLDVVKLDELVDYWDRGLSTPDWVKRPLGHRNLNNLAERLSYNAIRLWISGGPTPDLANMALVANNGWSPATDITLNSILENDKTLSTICQWRDRVKNILQTCDTLRMGVILVSGSPANVVTYETSYNATTATNQQIIINFWKQTIKEFGAYAALIGIDPLNEPLTSPKSGQFTNLTISNDRTAMYGWPQLAQLIIYGVRTQEQAQALDRPTPIVICTAGGDPMHARAFNAAAPGGGSPTYLKDPGLSYSGWSSLVSSAGATGWIVYQFHYYGSGSITCQGLSSDTVSSLGWTYPAGNLRRISRYWDSSGNWIDKSYMAVAEDWGDKIEPMNGMNDILAQWAEPIALRNTAQAGGKTQPIFVGEFSYIQPVLENVYPPNPERLQLAWEQNHPDLLRSSVTVGTETKKYYPNWSDLASHPRSRWITEFDIFTRNGVKYVRAYFDNISRWSFGIVTSNGVTYTPPAPPTDGLTTTNRANLSATQDLPGKIGQSSDYVMGFNVPVTRTSVATLGNAPLNWPASEFKNTLLISVTAGVAGTDKFVVTKVPVTIQADQYWVEYVAPDQTVTTGIYRQPLGTDNHYPAVAIASFFSATNNTDMETARAFYVWDVLTAAQSSGFSWAYFSCNALDGFIGFVPGPQMDDLLRQASLGRKLPLR